MNMSADGTAEIPLVSQAELRLLLDRQQIHDVMMRYCRAVDRIDGELLRSCYWPEATDDHGPFKGTAEQLFAAIDAMSSAYGVTQHLICNEYVEVEGDRACCESYFLMPAGLEREGPKIWVLGGRYVDTFERRHGEWRIIDRTVTYDWETVVTGAEQVFSPNPFAKGERSTDDIIYRKRAEVLGSGASPRRAVKIGEQA